MIVNVVLTDFYCTYKNSSILFKIPSFVLHRGKKHFFCSYHESQWGPMWFWIPLKFITQIKIVKNVILFYYYYYHLFCYTEVSHTTNQYEMIK